MGIPIGAPPHPRTLLPDVPSVCTSSCISFSASLVQTARDVVASPGHVRPPKPQVMREYLTFKSKRGTQKTSQSITKRGQLGIALMTPGLATYLWLLTTALVLGLPTLCDHVQLPEGYTACACRLRWTEYGWKGHCTCASIRVHLDGCYKKQEYLKSAKIKLLLLVQVFLGRLFFFFKL